ncbi:MAG TPA: glycoside hydrolase 100 family protein [Gemmatimonadaceae bacterium]|nr:glycoside hydrolase 100 family protein [Gemmatimonadaceae bacterium]
MRLPCPVVGAGVKDHPAPCPSDREARLTVPHLDAAVTLLRTLSGPGGIHASHSGTANYRAVFARDGVMAGIAGLLLHDDAITAGLVRTLEGLRDTQGTEGQVASNFEMRAGASPQVSFGSLAPRIDGATWYLLGVALAARRGVINPDDFEESVRAAVRVLDALEYNGRHLIYVPTGGNWADEYIYDGYILYDQVLRAWALRLLAVTYEEHGWSEKAAKIAARIDDGFWPEHRSTSCHPVASFSPVNRRHIFDLAACSLLALSDIAPTMSAAALEWISATFLRPGALPPAFHPVIHEGDADWDALSQYHLHGFRNRPHEYHNGGIWPIWLGWLALALAHTGRRADLAQLTTLAAAQLTRTPTYDFEEYFHGATGASLGTPQMAYSATGIVFLEHAARPETRTLFST